MTWTNIVAIWALALCLVAVGWTHEQGYQDSLGNPKYDAKEQVIAACGEYLERQYKTSKGAPTQ